MRLIVGVGLGLRLDEPIGAEAPDLAGAAALVPLGMGRTLVDAGVLGHDGCGVGDLSAEGVVYVLADAPVIVQRELPATVAQLGIVGLGRGGTEEVRQRQPRAEHIARIALEDLEGTRQRILP